MSAVKGRGIGGVAGWVDEHGRLQAVEAARQRRAGRLDGERFAQGDGSLHCASRPASTVPEHAAGCDFGCKVERGIRQRLCAVEAQGKADRDWLTATPIVGSFALAD